MGAHDVIRQLQQMDVDERAKVRDWLDAHDTESDALLTAIDLGLHSLAEGQAQPFEFDELFGKVRQWAGGSWDGRRNPADLKLPRD